MGWLDGLSSKQIEAVNTIDEDLEIIACAGAGKTGVVTRRVVNILKQKKDVLPENIVAFTFTEKAAEELKASIYKYGEEVFSASVISIQHNILFYIITFLKCKDIVWITSSELIYRLVIITNYT